MTVKDFAIAALVLAVFWVAFGWIVTGKFRWGLLAFLIVAGGCLLFGGLLWVFGAWAL